MTRGGCCDICGNPYATIVVLTVDVPVNICTMHRREFSIAVWASQQFKLVCMTSAQLDWAIDRGSEKDVDQFATYAYGAQTAMQSWTLTWLEEAKHREEKKDD